MSNVPKECGLVSARQTNPDGTPKCIQHDAGALALQGLLGNKQLKSAKAVKDLRDAMGDMPKSVGGKDIHTLRREKKKSAEELIAQQNERFIRNRLSGEKIGKPNTFVSPAAGTICAPITFEESTEKRTLPSPTNLNASGKYESKVDVRRSKIRRASLKDKYDSNIDAESKEKAAKLVDITKVQSSPVKEQRVTQLIEDTIAMGMDTGDAKQMMIEELSK